MNDYTFHLQALSDIWMGGPLGNKTKEPILNEKSLIGALRWWTEAIIRSAGGFACDPTATDSLSKNTTCDADHHCLACEIFGCQGWAKRFSLSIHETDGADESAKAGEFRYQAGRENNRFSVKFDFFYPSFPAGLKAILLRSAFVLFKYGTFGGRIGAKPPIAGSKTENEPWHKDYGLVRMINKISLPGISMSQIRQISDSMMDRFKEGKEAKIASMKPSEPWPNFNYFFFYPFIRGSKKASAVLNYEQINDSILGLEEDKLAKRKGAAEWQRWLRGHDINKPKAEPQQSKRVFFFRCGRIWGWAKDENMLTKDIIPQLAAVLGENADAFLTGETILKKVFGE